MRATARSASSHTTRASRRYVSLRGGLFVGAARRFPGRSVLPAARDWLGGWWPERAVARSGRGAAANGCRNGRTAAGELGGVVVTPGRRARLDPTRSTFHWNKKQAAYPVPSGSAYVSPPDDRVKHSGVSGPPNPSIVAWDAAARVEAPPAPLPSRSPGRPELTGYAPETKVEHIRFEPSLRPVWRAARRRRSKPTPPLTQPNKTPAKPRGRRSWETEEAGAAGRDTTPPRQAQLERGGPTLRDDIDRRVLVLALMKVAVHTPSRASRHD
jgi:hypothetical protein